VHDTATDERGDAGSRVDGRPGGSARIETTIGSTNTMTWYQRGPRPTSDSTANGSDE